MLGETPSHAPCKRTYFIHCRYSTKIKNFHNTRRFFASLFSIKRIGKGLFIKHNVTPLTKEQVSADSYVYAF